MDGDLLSVLEDLYDQRDTLMPGIQDEKLRGYVSPRMVGGRDGSRHSYALARLVRRGYAERWLRSMNGTSRGSYLYRITDAGRAALGGG